jgi:DHA2 family multidrug resistance protein
MAEQDHAAWRPAHSPWLVAAAVMSATIMEVLDTSVANVSLPHIAGTMSATPNEATWVLTSYLVANAVVLPMTAWLSGRFGRKRYLLFSVVLFTLASALCGIAPSLNFLVFARILQGLGGGGLQPLSQAVLLETFAPEERGVAMAAYGMGIIVAPIIGPTLGGWITDSYSWRWIFYINIPIGVLAVSMIRTFVEDPPYLRQVKGRSIDFLGFGLLVLWISALQLVLDKGQEADWFGSAWICWTAAVAVVGFLAFIWWELRVDHPIVELRVLKNRNFAVGCVLVMVLGATLYGTTVLLPLYLQTLMGYTAMLSGMVVSPRGLGSMVSMIVVGRLVKKVDNRYLGCFGFLVVGFSTWWLSRINLDVTIGAMIVPLIVTGFAMGFLWVPLTTLSVGTLRVDEINLATPIYSLTRNMGAALGISALTSMLERRAQAHQVTLSSHLTAFDPEVRRRLAAAAAALGPKLGGGSYAAMQAAMGSVYGQLLRQASLLSYVDAFRIVAILAVLFGPLVLMFQQPKYAVRADAAGH